MKQGLPPVLAVPWRAAGFTPERASALISRGIVDPSKAPQYDPSDSDDTATEAESSSKKGAGTDSDDEW
jgi:hypothetical protein